LTEHRDSRSGKSLSKQVAGIGCLVLLVPFIVIASPLILAFALWNHYDTIAIRREFLKRWPGKRGILVYSNSPNWGQYIEQNWLPRIGSRFVLLNWSERARWAVERPFEARVFRTFGGDRNFNPLAIIFLERVPGATVRAWLSSIRKRDLLGVLAPDRHNTAVIRFFQAFRDFKHGKDQLLRTKEAELFSLCDDTDGIPPK
jgi:hypothetical protein